MKNIILALTFSILIMSCKDDETTSDPGPIRLIEPFSTAQESEFYPLFQSAPDFFSPKDYVVRIVRQHENNLYIVTSVGVGISQDNGLTFEFKNVRGLATSRIQNLYFYQDTVYICTDRGIIVSDPNLSSFKSVANDENFKGGAVSSMQIFEGKVYLATANGVYITDLEFKTFSKLPLLDKEHSIKTFEIQVARPHNKKTHIFVATTSGLFISRNEGRNFKNLTTQNSKLPNNIINSITLNVNNLYLSTPSGLVVSPDFGETFSVKTIANKLPHQFINKTVISDTNSVFILTKGGLAVSKDAGNTFVSYTSLTALPAEGLNDLTINSKDMSIAIASDMGLITTSDLNNPRYQIFKMNNLLSEKLNVTAIWAKDEKNILFGTRLGLLRTTDGGTSIVRKTNSLDFSDNEITNIHYFAKNTYITTPFGVGKSTNQIQFSSIIDDTPVNQMTHYNDILLLATDTGIAFSTNENNNFIFSEGDQGLPKEGVNTVVIYDRNQDLSSEDEEKNLSYDYIEVPLILAGTNSGFYTSYGPNNFQLFDGDIPKETITDVTKNNRTIYVTTKKSLYISKDHGQSYISRKIVSESSPAEINKVLAIGRHIFVATTDGVFVSDDNGETFFKKIITNKKNLKNFSLNVKSMFILKEKYYFIVYLGTACNIFKSEKIGY